MKQEIQRELTAAFDTDLKDAVKSFTGAANVQTSNDDDWLVGAVSNSQANYEGRGVFTGFNKSEIDGQSILLTDVKLICLQNEVTQEPKVDDLIDGQRVVSVQQDPVSASFVIQLRGA